MRWQDGEPDDDPDIAQRVNADPSPGFGSNV
jgi:hypothetical protein